MEHRRRFTEEEDRVILSRIAADASNLSRTFVEISMELGRNPASFATRWYKYLARKDTNCKTNIGYVTYGQCKMNINRKISREDTQQPSPIKKSKWRRILDILFE